LNKKGIVGHFAYFDGMRHLITGREGLVEDLTWAPYDLLMDEARKLVFRRRESPGAAL